MFRTTVQKMNRTAYDMKVEAIGEKAERCGLGSLTDKETSFLMAACQRQCKEHPETMIPPGKEESIRIAAIAAGLKIRSAR